MRKMGKLATILVALLMFAGSAKAGSCPSGAIYTNPTNPIGPQITLASIGVTNCYYIAANGSDSNDGASEASSHAWAHAPGMSTCASNCAANTPGPGKGYIFRGGDTWHFGNSSATPYVGSGSWLIPYTWIGSSTTDMVYYGVDPGWYSGSSWARPIMTGDNPTSTSPVASCAYQTGDGNTMLYLKGASWEVVDNFEWTGFCWNGNGGNVIQYLSGNGTPQGQLGPPWYIQNNYLHGWTHTTGGTQSGGNGFQGSASYFGVFLQMNVIDGSDSDDLSLQALGQGTDEYVVRYNVFRHIGGTTVSDDCHIIHDNLWEYMNNVTDGSAHTDVLFCYGEANDQNHSADATPNLFYNNVWRYIGTEYSAPISYEFTGSPPANKTDYVFNNVWHDIYQPGGNNGVVWCDGGSCNSGAAVALMNNTFEASLPNYGGCIICDSPGVAITSVNNYWVTNQGTGISAVFANTPDVTETMPVYQTLSVANAQGYTSANDFAPTLSSDATVVASGINENTQICAAMSSAGASADAVTACETGTTDACSYNVTSHSVSCPGYTAVARPLSSAWNVGAYQFNGSISGAPAPPSNLSATVN
jgi:hypothetical protein